MPRLTLFLSPGKVIIFLIYPTIVSNLIIFSINIIVNLSSTIVEMLVGFLPCYRGANTAYHTFIKFPDPNSCSPEDNPF